MRLAQVLGQVWASKQIPQLDGRQMVLVRDASTNEVHAAVDLIGVSAGTRVLIVTDEAAVTALAAPIDAAVVALVADSEVVRDVAG